MGSVSPGAEGDELAGAELADVVKATIFLEDARDFGRYNRVFAQFFPDACLARAFRFVCSV
ncbi:MAG: hypothetical protein HC850_09535 [Rhodomicrobium sp.]|nr:hypothetical protein [Rhodomicrobium sp.]